MSKQRKMWSDVVDLPRGFTLPGEPGADPKSVILKTFGKTYPCGMPRFDLEYDDKWRVYPVCPCGFRECSDHVIPSESTVQGDSMHEGEDLSVKFSSCAVMTTDEALSWWGRYGDVHIEGNVIRRTIFWEWNEVCDFPKCHELQGAVREGEERETLERSFSQTYPDGQPKYSIAEDGECFVVKQLCPCGKSECDAHVIPSAVRIDAPFDLNVHVNRTVMPFEESFRLLDPMSCEDVRDWFLGLPLKWEVTVTPSVVTLRMLCKCGKACARVPCPPCAQKTRRECSQCKRVFSKRYVKGGLCGNCRRTRVVHCEHCNEKKPLVHKCKPLWDNFYTDRVTGIYPPCVRNRGSDDVMCPDCHKCMKYNVYHRHQYRVHSDLYPGTGGYSREYKRHKCPYCDYTNCDITNVREHTKVHLSLRQHACRHGCGAMFTRPSAETLHCRIVHGDSMPPSPPELKRVGNELVRVAKRRRINYASPALVLG